MFIVVSLDKVFIYLVYCNIVQTFEILFFIYFSIYLVDLHHTLVHHVHDVYLIYNLCTK